MRLFVPTGLQAYGHNFPARCVYDVNSFASKMANPSTYFTQFDERSDDSLYDLQLMSLSKSLFASPCSCLLLHPLTPLPDFLGHSCHRAPRPYISLLHSGPFCCLLSNVSPLSLRPLRGSGTTRRVNSPRPAANFCRDLPSPWPVSSTVGGAQSN